MDSFKKVHLYYYLHDAKNFYGLYIEPEVKKK